MFTLDANAPLLPNAQRLASRGGMGPHWRSQAHSLLGVRRGQGVLVTSAQQMQPIRTSATVTSDGSRALPPSLRLHMLLDPDLRWISLHLSFSLEVRAPHAHAAVGSNQHRSSTSTQRAKRSSWQSNLALLARGESMAVPRARRRPLSKTYPLSAATYCDRTRARRNSIYATEVPDIINGARVDGQKTCALH